MMSPSLLQFTLCRVFALQFQVSAEGIWGADDTEP